MKASSLKEVAGAKALSDHKGPGNGQVHREIKQGHPVSQVGPEQQWRVLRVIAEKGPLAAATLSGQVSQPLPSLTRIARNNRRNSLFTLDEADELSKPLQGKTAAASDRRNSNHSKNSAFALPRDQPLFRGTHHDVDTIADDADDDDADDHDIG